MTTGRLRPQQSPSKADERESRAELAVSVLEARTHRPVVVPRTAVKGDMRLLSRAEVKQIRADLRAALAERGIAGGADISAYVEWREEFYTRVVATAVRLPADRTLPLASLDEWEECDEDQVLALWEAYEDMREQLDPIGGELSEAELRAIEAAAKKNSEDWMDRLMRCGSRKLALALAGMAARSPT